MISLAASPLSRTPAALVSCARVFPITLQTSPPPQQAFRSFSSTFSGAERDGLIRRFYSNSSGDPAEENASDDSESRSVLVYGGNGALGQAFVRRFAEEGWRTVSADFRKNQKADRNFILDPDLDWKANAENLSHSMNSWGQARCIVNTAGGWCPGNLSSEDFLKDSETMWQANVASSLTAAYVAARHLAPGGMLVLTGASPVLRAPSPYMLSYAVAKATVHSLVRNLSVESTGLPHGARVVCILPTTIDTVSNRKAMPDADHGSWTPPEVFADTVLGWAEGSNKVEQGGFYEFVTNDGHTHISLMQRDVSIRRKFS